MGHNTSVPIFSHNRTPVSVDKGVYEGACNRQRCQKHPATFYSRSTHRYYCAACAHKLNVCNPPSEELIRVGIVGHLCIPITDPSHPYHDSEGGLFVPHSVDVRVVINNIFEEEGRIPDGESLMKKVMTWNHRLNPNVVKELIVDEVCKFNARTK